MYFDVEFSRVISVVLVFILSLLAVFLLTFPGFEIFYPEFLLLLLIKF